MSERRTRDLRSTQLVNDVFRVCQVIKRVRPKDSHCFTVTLTDGVSRYEAMVGRSAAPLAPGELIYLHGCILRRRGEPVLVACSVRPVSHETKIASPSAQRERQ